MRQFSFYKYFLLTIFISINCFAQIQKLQPKVILPEQIEWNNSGQKNYSIQTFNLLGNPKENEYYVQMVKIPSNTKLFPHFHPDNRTVYVVSGYFYYCYESEFNEMKTTKFTTGTFFTEPANQPHFAYTKESEVVLYVSGFGPTKTIFIEENKK